MDDLTDYSHFRVGDLLVVPDRLLVARGGQEIKLEPRMMQVLVMLVEHASETVSKEALLVEVWGSTVYGDSPVNKTVSNLRKLIGDDSRNPRYIETVSKVGYRVIAPVSLPENYRRMPSEAWTEGSPYVGLSAFDAKHASVFCGRSRIVANLLRAMRSQIESQRRFVLIVGASGCGKTSLLRAGAIPLLTKPDGFDGLHALSVADCDLAAAPAGDPLTPLAVALAGWTLGDRPVLPPQTTEQLKTLLTETQDTIPGFVAEAFRRHPERSLAEQPYAHLLLTIDHAEALVATTDIDTSALDAFTRVLQALCACPHLLVTMIVRGDFYLKLIQTLPAVAEYKAGDGHLDVMTPQDGEIGEIIRSPAWKADLSFDIEPETRTLLDDALREAALSQPDALPLLQHTLQTLYERRNNQRQLTFAAYNEIGGLEGAIAHRTEEVFSALPANAQASLDAVLAKLIVIHPDNDAVSARRADIDTFEVGARVLIDAFISARLFVSDHHNGHRIFGVAHEALLRRWPRAVEWAQDNQRLLQAKARLQRAAARWMEEGRKDDHLLNPGRPLGEAVEARNRMPEELGEQENEFLRAAEKFYGRKKFLRNAAISVLAASAVTSTLLSIFAFDARNDAIDRRQETLRLIDFMMVELADQLRPQGNLKLLDSISHEALEILQSRKIDDLSVSELIQHSKALTLIGEVSLKKAENTDALKAFRHAQIVGKKALSMKQDSVLALNEISQINFWIGYYFYKKNEFSQALDHWKSYYSLRKKLVAIEPDNAQWKVEESYAVNNLGTLYADLGKYDDALVLFKESLEMKQLVAASNPENESLRIELIDTQSWISKCHAFTGSLDQASIENMRQISIMRGISGGSPEAKSWKRGLANALARSADVEMMRGRLAVATEQIEESVRLLSDLIDAEKGNKEWLRDFAFAHMKAGDIALSNRLDSIAKEHYSIANDAVEQLMSAAESNIEWNRLRHLIMVRHAGSVHDYQTADKAMSSAILELEKLHAKYPADYSALIALSDVFARRARFKQTRGKNNSAKSDWLKVLSITHAIAGTTQDPRIVDIREEASRSRL